MSKVRYKYPPLPWHNDSKKSRRLFRKLLAESYKGPQINPPASDSTRRRTLGYEMQYLNMGLRHRRAIRRVPALEKDQMRALPRATEQTWGCGVYFLWHGPILLYVGKSNEIGARLWRHANRHPMKRFTHATWVAVHDEMAKMVEREFVHKHRPPLNIARHG